MSGGDPIMKYDPNTHHRRSVRLSQWNYSWGWWYYVTICTHDRKCVLGQIRNDTMILSKIGEIVREQWMNLPQHFSNVELDDCVIMPNHMHGIVILNDDRRGLISQTPALFIRFSSLPPLHSHTIPRGDRRRGAHCAAAIDVQSCD